LAKAASRFLLAAARTLSAAARFSAGVEPEAVKIEAAEPGAVELGGVESEAGELGAVELGAFESGATVWVACAKVGVADRAARIVGAKRAMNDLRRIVLLPLVC
jgi:hypothetical protein